MADVVYRLEYLRERILRCLRGQQAAVSTERIGVACGLPLWAVERGLESLAEHGLVVFAAGQGWWVEAVAPVGGARV